MALRAPIVLVQTPAGFEDSPTAVEAARRFFSKAERRGIEIAVEMRGWNDDSIAALCEEHGLIDCRDPFKASPVAYGACRTAYFRLHGSPPGPRIYRYRYTTDDLARLRETLRGLTVTEAFVFFNNLSMNDDARSFLKTIV